MLLISDVVIPIFDDLVFLTIKHMFLELLELERQLQIMCLKLAESSKFEISGLSHNQRIYQNNELAEFEVSPFSLN